MKTVLKPPAEGLLRKLPSTVGTVAALATVHSKLAIATAAFYQVGDGGKAGVYRAIADVVDYFVSQGIPYATLAPLTAVAAAIVDAESGIKSLIFQPARTGAGRPPKSVMHDVMDQQLAVVTDCCIRHLKSRKVRPYLEEATRLAAKLVNDSPLIITVTAVQMRETLERVRQLPPNHDGRKQFDLLRSGKFATPEPLKFATAFVRADWLAAPPD